MTVPGNLSSTHFPAVAPTKTTEKPTSAGNSASTGGAAQTTASATQPQPSAPAGLVGHHVNTTA
ncbi:MULTISPECIES: hypothetical protein [Paraburkholderia]|uniref:Uncharacterized protein n=1 Tax=Paraburkholderia caledonica TaxID=134536 RepID=A0ABU1L864_9BURK|nr:MULTISPECIES: hypothetical protein [Paraburkholderia]MDR6379399.1 hypothetical protein [Paraburkholderia caledonica]MDR7009053.1 hypothetical protein [Paraburkholderia strydomiana]OWJ56954.1 hypothetical protein BWU74_28265 [Burkholderia sp. Bk]